MNNIEKLKLRKIFIYLNLIIIYAIIYKLYKKTDLLYSKLNNNNNHHHPYLNKYYEDIAFNSIINKRKRLSIVWPIPLEIKIKPVMTEKELIAFSYFMNPENIYFEFGSGGSTNIASFYKVKTYSVESDKKYTEKLKKKGIVANFILIDLKVNHWGYPGNRTNNKEWKKYIQAYKKEYNADIILIDGRFRVACALDIFTKIRNDTIILIHDYENRKEYHILEQFFIKIKKWDSLALFFKKPNIEKVPENIYNFYLLEPK